MPTLNPRQPQYTVKPGDTLNAIAQAQYGNPAAGVEIGRSNGIFNARALPVGKVLRLSAILVTEPNRINYRVPGMKLIPQQQEYSCWYASAQMLIHWRRSQTQRTELQILDPKEDQLSVQMRKQDDGLANAQLAALAHRLGLVLVAPLSPSAELLGRWLVQYGPLWVNGETHIVVIAGIRQNVPTLPYKRAEVLVYDPSPKKVGVIQWRSVRGWYLGNEPDSRDTSMDVPEFSCIARGDLERLALQHVRAERARGPYHELAPVAIPSIRQWQSRSESHR